VDSFLAPLSGGKWNRCLKYGEYLTISLFKWLCHSNTLFIFVLGCMKTTEKCLLPFNNRSALMPFFEPTLNIAYIRCILERLAGEHFSSANHGWSSFRFIIHLFRRSHAANLVHLLVTGRNWTSQHHCASKEHLMNDTRLNDRFLKQPFFPQTMIPFDLWCVIYSESNSPPTFGQP